MRKALLIALIAILFVALFTGCRAYRRTTVTTPGYEVTTNTDGRTTRGVYPNNGTMPGTGVTVHPSHTVHNNTRQNTTSHYRHDGRVTDTDGIIGNGTFADRPAADGYSTPRRAVDSVDGTLGPTGGRTNFDVNPGTGGIDAYRMGGNMDGATRAYVR